MCEEVARKTDDYLSNVIMAKNCIEERKNDLNAAMKIARELKSAPSLRTYCDLNQVILIVHDVHYLFLFYSFKLYIQYYFVLALHAQHSC